MMSLVHLVLTKVQTSEGQTGSCLDQQKTDSPGLGQALPQSLDRGLQLLDFGHEAMLHLKPNENFSVPPRRRLDP